MSLGPSSVQSDQSVRGLSTPSKPIIFVDQQQPRRKLQHGNWNTLKVFLTTEGAEMVGYWKQETQTAFIHVGQVRVIYRDDGIVIPRKARRTSFEQGR